MIGFIDFLQIMRRSERYGADKVLRHAGVHI